MRRAVILTTLALLLFAVAGVTAAREKPFTNPLAGDQTKSTASESTSMESTVQETALPERTVADPDDIENGGVSKSGDSRDMKSSEHERVDKPDHSATGGPQSKGPAPGIGKREAARAREPDDARRHYNVAESNEREKHGTGRPDSAGRSHFGRHEPGKRGERGGGREKVTLCHIDKVTITVGAPARDAHMRHGDSEGACEKVAPHSRPERP